jgi:hypothetical protein
MEMGEISLLSMVGGALANVWIPGLFVCGAPVRREVGRA